MSLAPSRGGRHASTQDLVLLFAHRHHQGLAAAIAEGARAEGAEVRLRRAREFVSPEVMAQAPGWKEQAVDERQI